MKKRRLLILAAVFAFGLTGNASAYYILGESAVTPFPEVTTMFLFGACLTGVARFINKFGK